MNRREFMIGTAALAALPAGPAATAAPATAPTPPIPAAVRLDFPWAANETYLNSANVHPLNVHAFQATQRYLEYRLKGPGEGREELGGEQQLELKRLYGALINARPGELAFVQNTSEGENIVANGLELGQRGGNVVIDDLSFATAFHLYRSIERQGVELRVVPSRDGHIELADMRAAIDGKTRLVSLPLVSSVNGYLHDIRAIADLAHRHGAYVYADLVQAAGAVPVDVREMGIDFAAASTYKWLMGERGLAYFYVREELQGSVLKDQRFGHRQVDGSAPAAGASRYEPGSIPNALAVCSRESLRYINRLGVANIRAHARGLTERLQRELPALGYPSLTPARNESPIVAFRIADPRRVDARLKERRIVATVVEKEQRLRLSVSVFNDHADLDRLLAALSPAAGPRP